MASILPLAGAANALMLSAAIAVRAVQANSRAGIYGAAFLAGAAAAAIVITLDHAGFDPGRALTFIEGALTLGSGPLLVLFVAALTGRRIVAAPLFLPMTAFVAATLFAPDFVLGRARVEYLVAAQIGFTLLALWLARRQSEPAGRGAGRRRMFALLIIGAVAAIHAAQIVRTLGADIGWLRDVVPSTMAVIFFALAGLVFFGARAALDPILSAPEAVSPETEALAAKLDAALTLEALRNPKLSLPDLARSIGVGPQAAAAALAGARRMAFKEYLLHRRVREAARLLRDRGERRTSMEAIGLLAGFGSRSAFYQAFRDQMGVTPAAFRAANDPEPVQKPETGQV